MHLHTLDPNVGININVSNHNQLCTQQSLLENYHFDYFKYCEIFIFFLRKVQQVLCYNYLFNSYCLWAFWQSMKSSKHCIIQLTWPIPLIFYYQMYHRNFMAIYLKWVIVSPMHLRKIQNWKCCSNIKTSYDNFKAYFKNSKHASD